MASYGRKSTYDVFVGEMFNQVRACVYGTMAENGWAYAYSIHAGKGDVADVNLRGEIWTLASGAPAALLANTNVLTATASFPDGSSSGVVTGPLTSVVKVATGSAYGVGVSVRDGQLRHGMIDAASLPGWANTQFYQRSNANNGPHDPMGYTSASTQGWLSNWFDYEPNVKPNVPINLAPVGDVASLPSSFTGAFRDDNELVGPSNIANPNEKLKQYRIQLREVGGSTLLWDSLYTASGGEQAVRAFDRAPSPSLTLGLPYEWRCQVSDQFDAWSDYTAWVQFTVAPGATVSIAGDGGVVDKQVTQTPGPFTVVYDHVDGLSTNAYQLQILQAGSVVRDTGTVSATWSPASSQSLAWPGGFTALSWGTAYTWRVRAKDTLNRWSPWSPAIPFWTNYRPGVPAQLSPSGGAVSSGYPLLTFAMTDADNTPATGLEAEVRIKDGSGTLIATREATLLASGKWGYQTTSADLAATGTFRWDARGLDPYLASAWASEVDFFYADAPDVVTPAVDAVLTSTSLYVEYVVTGQQRRHFLIYRRGEASPVYVTGWGTSTTSFSATLDLSSFVVNGGEYDLVVETELTGAVVSRSDRVPFEVLLNASHGVAVSLGTSGPIAIASEPDPSAIRLVFGTVTGVTGGNFREWRVKEATPEWLDRWTALLANPPADAGDALRAKVRLAAELETVTTSTSYTDTQLVHFAPLLGVPMVYTLTAVIQAGVTVVESLPVTILSATCKTSAIVIHDLANPSGRRVMLQRMSKSGMSDVAESSLYSTWSDGPPVIVESGLRYRTVKETYRLMPQDGQLPLVVWDTIRELRSARSDGSPTVIVYRDDIGERLTGKLTRAERTRERLSRMTADLEITEVAP